MTAVHFDKPPREKRDFDSFLAQFESAEFSAQLFKAQYRDLGKSVLTTARTDYTFKPQPTQLSWVILDELLDQPAVTDQQRAHMRAVNILGPRRGRWR